MVEVYIAISYIGDNNDGEIELFEEKEKLDAFIEKIKTEKGVCYERRGWVDTYSYLGKFDDDGFAYRHTTNIYTEKLYNHQKVEPMAPYEIGF